jgi:putative transposase
MYSKSIVGYNVANSLNTDGCLSALKQAIVGRKYKNGMIHHSDRGVQYCSNEYQNVLQKNKIICSMTQDSDPYENAIAERINGILKQEFYIDKYDLDLKQTKKMIKEANYVV